MVAAGRSARGAFRRARKESSAWVRAGRAGGAPTSVPFTSISAVPRAARARGRRGRRGRMFESGQLRLVLLKLIADEPRHGYDLIRAIEELTGGEYAPSPGVIYPTLTLLQDMGLIEEAPGEGARKPFQVTEEGRKHLEGKCRGRRRSVRAPRRRWIPPAPEPAAGDGPRGRQSDGRAQEPGRPGRAGTRTCSTRSSTSSTTPPSGSSGSRSQGRGAGRRGVVPLIARQRA